MRTSPQSVANRGFTLVEVAVVLVILAVLISMAAAITRGVTAAQKRSLTTVRMSAVDAALVQFVARQRRLPCPADGTLASTHANAGLERRSPAGVCLVDQIDGVAPWRALALTEVEVTDGWDRRLTYRVAPPLALDGGMDMTACDPAGIGAAGAGNTCSSGCTSGNMATCTPPNTFLGGKGLEVRRADGVTKLMDPASLPHTGAAYVLVSHGESGGGGYLSGGVLGATSSTDGTQEMKNYANVAYVAGVYFVDDTLVETAGTTHFDDVVSRPSIMGVVSKAGLGPRAH